MTKVQGELEPVKDTAGFSGSRLARIDNFFNVEIAQGRVPGAVLLVERHGETVVKRAWGYRNRAAGTPMTLDTIFRIYSMTKPIVSLATMMLAGEGKLHLGQPVSDFIPAFAKLQVLADGKLETPRAPPTIYDLLRHTSGLTYARNGGPVAPLLSEAAPMTTCATNEAFADKIAAIPLTHQPGRVWEYGHSTEVLGRVVEVVAGRSLGAVLRNRLFEPLGMTDTGFRLADDKLERLAEPFASDTFEDGEPMFDARRDRSFEAGGMGLLSTLDDYANFARMLLADGTSENDVVVSRHTLALMTADHVGPDTGVNKAASFMPGPGYGFGLGFAVRNALGGSPYAGTVGEYTWSGIGGTYFWVDPEMDLFVVLLTQSPKQRLRYRAVIRALVYDALIGGRGLKAERRRRKVEPLLV